MNLCMIGTGYVGLVSGTCFADLGNRVYCVDKDKNKINKLNSGISPIYEPGLDELIKKNYAVGRLIFTNDLKKAISKSELIFICVGTPNKKNLMKLICHMYLKLQKKLLNVQKIRKYLLQNQLFQLALEINIEKLLKKLKKILR